MKPIVKKGMAPKFSFLRIIGGEYRSRKLQFPEVEGLRPTGNRIRETLFNWLSPHIEGAHCLDLFAGSGALGLEALSRGAAHVTFIDSSPLVCKSIHENLEQLKNKASTLKCTDALGWLDKAPSKFDIIFIDPPFGTKLIEAACKKLETTESTKCGSLIYIEDAITNPEPALPDNWQMLKNKKTGAVRYQLYRRA